MEQLNTPVLLIIFNRPEKVRRLIESLASVKPRKIYIVADGPRISVESDKEKCNEAREVAVNIPWDCEIHTKFFDENLRSRHKAVDYTVVAGLDWFFSENEFGIVLEDDCIPNITFYKFCEELLKKYKDNTKIMHISGNNFQNGIQRGAASYYFSFYTHSWGWATWKRAWNQFHPAVEDMGNYDAEKRVELLTLSKAAKKFWMKSYRTKRHWDSLWQYTVWHENGLSILPNQNLVSNIGFDEEATNTRHDTHFSNMSTSSLEKIIHPATINANESADEYTFKTVFYTPIYKRVWIRLRNLIKN